MPQPIAQLESSFDTQPNLTEDQYLFVEEIASLLTSRGMPQTASRLYGYLLLHDEPVSLDKITQDLEVSKSSASVAARMLEQYMLARRHGERGSKRVLYSASETYDGLIADQSFLLGQMGQLIERRTPEVAGGMVAKRLNGMSDFYLSMQAAIDGTVQQHNAKRGLNK